MSVLEGVSFAIFALSVVAATGAWVSSSYWIDHLKRSGQIPKTMPDLVGWGSDLGAAYLERVYTDFHRDYGSRFISRCAWILRVTTVAAPVAWLLFMISTFALA